MVTKIAANNQALTMLWCHNHSFLLIHGLELIPFVVGDLNSCKQLSSNNALMPQPFIFTNSWSTMNAILLLVTSIGSKQLSSTNALMSQTFIFTHSWSRINAILLLVTSIVLSNQALPMPWCHKPSFLLIFGLELMPFCCWWLQ